MTGLELAAGGALAAADLAVEHLDGVGAAEVEVVGDQRLKKPRVAGLGEHQGAGHLDLGHRQLHQ